MIREMRQKFGGIAGLQAFPTEVPAIGGQRSEPLQFAVRGQSLEQVGQYATLLNEELGKIEGLGRINFNLQLEMPQLQLHVDRVRARSLGLSTRDVALAANVLAGGVDIARYNDDPGDGERYDIRLKGAEGVFRSPSDLSKIYLRSDAGEL
ncbi:MAG TPA: AcrB/AcrD/AcrF family protein, partial [Gammaproteobacteria bacterium]|nr:AcrB/AcrD/AcrF family protein [Gammaproteobacteria bacterium]MCH78079.1 AcrB/AcrD/AcrF family protein [Gammaproteobacteria bacterium]